MVRGWLAYAPLLTILRQPADAVGLVRECAAQLERCDCGLLAYFGAAWAWPPPSRLLRLYLSAAGRELAEYERTQCVWRALCGKP